MDISLSTIYGIGGSNKGKPIFFGRNGAVGTGYESLDTVGVDRDQYSIFAGTAAKLDVSSSAAADAAAGTGAQQVTVYGLSGTYQPISEVVTLGGFTAATTVLAFLRVHGMKVTRAGSGRINAGDIYAVGTTTSTWTNGVPDTLTSCVGKILVGLGQDMSGCWTSPPFTQVKFKKIRVGIRGDVGTVALFLRPLSGAAATQIKTAMEFDSFTGAFEIDGSLLPPISPLTDVVFRAKAGSGTALVSVQAYLEKI